MRCCQACMQVLVFPTAEHGRDITVEAAAASCDTDLRVPCWFGVYRMHKLCDKGACLLTTPAACLQSVLGTSMCDAAAQSMADPASIPAAHRRSRMIHCCLIPPPVSPTCQGGKNIHTRRKRSWQLGPTGYPDRPLCKVSVKMHRCIVSCRSCTVQADKPIFFMKLLHKP